MVKSILGAFQGVEIDKRTGQDDIEYIYYKDIKPAEKNRELHNIETLAEDIAEDGLDHNLIIRKIKHPTSNHKYEIVAGHRRFSAINLNIKNGNMDYEHVPCKIKEYEDEDARRRLLLNNLNTDGYTQAEMLDVIEELKEIYLTKKKRGEKMPGRIQELIAKDVGLGKTQVGNYEKVINNAIPEVKKEISAGNISINEASELSSLEHEEQLKFIENNDQFDLKTIKEYKESLEVDDYDDYTSESDEEMYDKCEDNNISTVNNTSSTTIQELIITVDKCFDLLLEKMDKAEWKNERLLIDDMMSTLIELKALSGIN